MRIWFIILMIAVALPLLPVLRANIKSLRFLNRPFLSSKLNFLSQKVPIISSSKYYSQSFMNMATAASSTPSGKMATSSVSSIPDKEQETLPKLSMEDFQAYNKQANMMEYYHNRFRQTWKVLYTACESNTRPKSMSLSQFMTLASNFVSHLTLHHDIEEAHIFPVLAKRMPEFSHHVSESESESESNPTARLMVLQHQQIHAGLGLLEKYLKDCRSGKRDFRLQGEGSLKEVLDTFGEVLWTHLDAEVKLLGAENMRKHWTKEEVLGFNW